MIGQHLTKAMIKGSSHKRKKLILVYGKEISRQKYVKTALKKKYRIRNTVVLPVIADWISEEHPHLIIFEFGDDKKAERETLKKLLGQEPKVKILVVVGKTFTKEVAAILKYGVLDVFPKPYEPQLLVERVEALLRTK